MTDFNEEADYDFGTDLDLDSVEELKVVESTQEVKVEIINVEPFKEKYYRAYRLRVIEQPGMEGPFRTIRHCMWLPKPEDDKEKTDNKLRAIKNFCRAFKVDMKVPCNQHIGAFSFATVKVVDSDYGRQNEIARLIIPNSSI